MKVDERRAAPLPALDKDAALIEMLGQLRQSWGDDSFDIVDHWIGDLCAIGVAKKGQPQTLAYICNFGKKRGKYYVELEGPPESASRPYDVHGAHDNVGFEELTALVGSHLGLDRH